MRSHITEDETNEPTKPETTKDESKTDDQVWKRPERRVLNGQDGQYIARFEVISARILPTENTNVKKYVLYTIQLRMDGGTVEDKESATIERRYTELLNLYENLRKESPDLVQNVVFPKKRLTGNFSESLIAERSVAFEAFLDHIVTVPALRDSQLFLEFVQAEELKRACLLLDERRQEQAIPILENCFRVLNKIYLDKSRPVLLLLCRLVAACTSSPIPHLNSEQWASIALRRFEHVSDVELLVLYVPLLQTCLNLYTQIGKDCQIIDERLKAMEKRGIKVKGTLPLQQAVHVMDKRSETA